MIYLIVIIMKCENWVGNIRSNAPLETPLQEQVQVQAQRFFIEHSFHETKSECGMADYQVRRWDAWHHHMALVMLATLSFWLSKRCWGASNGQCYPSMT
jgi:SRSO17 transposase